MTTGSTNSASTARDRVLITGAGSGLGLALAQRYARDGARLLIADLDGSRAETACAALPDPTRGATHDHAEDRLPRWAVGLVPTAALGGLVFYRLHG